MASEPHQPSASDLRTPPAILTVAEEWLGWTLDRTADFPSAHRHSFGQRLSTLTLDLLESLIEARYAPAGEKPLFLRGVNLLLEKLRMLWRLVEGRGWISQPQLLYAGRNLDEIGRMAGGWLRAK